MRMIMINDGDVSTKSIIVVSVKYNIQYIIMITYYTQTFKRSSISCEKINNK